VTPDVLVHAQDLVKRFPPKERGGVAFTAVDGITFDLHRGESFGILGPNGAGKSSTMRMIACVSPATSGTLSVLGLDPAKDGRRIRARIGVVPQDDALDRELPVMENLLIYGRYFGLPKPAIAEKAAALLDFAQLQDKAAERVEALSGGMRRRLTIARSLINEPEILLLDEPTTGLDPQARHVLWDRLFRLKQQGVTLILTTHYMDEAEQLCDRLIVMDKGRIVAEGSPRELIEAHATREVLELRFRPDEQAVAEEKVRTTGGRFEALPDRLLWYADDGEAALATAHRIGLEPVTALVRRSTLEDVFLALTGRTLVD
jgi:lipooligosaccharide transport system ATP-binding protein